MSPLIISYCADAWTGVCFRCAWMTASVGVCVSQYEWDLRSQQHV